jgi:hypothetical protein
MQIVRVVLSTCLFLTIVANALAQSTDPCNNHELRRAWESDPIYTEAMELARTLENRGFVVECVRSSKQAAFFEGEKGAAWYKTKQGVFEVLFLPVSQNFEGLQIVAESKPGDRHTYVFRGAPHISTTMDSAKPMVFIKHKNLLFEVWGNEELAKQLTHAWERR